MKTTIQESESVSSLSEDTSQILTYSEDHINSGNSFKAYTPTSELMKNSGIMCNSEKFINSGKANIQSVAVLKKEANLILKLS